MPESLGCGMRSAATFELRVPAGNNAPFTGIFGASSVGVVRCDPSHGVYLLPSAWERNLGALAMVDEKLLASNDGTGVSGALLQPARTAVALLVSRTPMQSLA